MTLTFEYLQSTGTMAATSVAAGSAARLNITAYNSSAYTHKVDVEIRLVHSDAEHCRRYCLRIVHDPALVACRHPQRHFGRCHGDARDA